MTSVLVDANIWISFLLGARRGSVIDQVVKLVFTSDFELVVPQELLDELDAVYSTSTYLRNRIPNSSYESLMSEFRSRSRILPPIRARRAYTRDPKDDYLIAQALF